MGRAFAVVVRLFKKEKQNGISKNRLRQAI